MPQNLSSLNGAYLHPDLNKMYFGEAQFRFNPFTNEILSQVDPLTLSIVLQKIPRKEDIKRVAFTAQAINPPAFNMVNMDCNGWPAVSELPGLEEVISVRNYSIPDPVDKNLLPKVL